MNRKRKTDLHDLPRDSDAVVAAAEKGGRGGSATAAELGQILEQMDAGGGDRVEVVSPGLNGAELVRRRVEVVDEALDEVQIQ